MIQISASLKIFDFSCIISVGRGKTSHAYFHSLHEDHHVYINLHTLKVKIRAIRQILQVLND